MRPAAIMRILAASRFLSFEAAKIIRNVRDSGNLVVIEKGIDDFSTLADRKAQLCIVASLRKAFPGLTIVGEEDLDPDEPVPTELVHSDFPASEVDQHPCPVELQNVKEEELVVWVDPLDGTSSYKKGYLDDVTVMIGLARGGVAIGGVVTQPYYNYQGEGSGEVDERCVWGLKGVGVFGVGEKATAKMDNVVVTTYSNDDDLVTRAVESFQSKEMIRCGGIGRKALALLEGRAHAHVFANGTRCGKWDTCAPEGLLRAAGGQVTDVLGRPISYLPTSDHGLRSGILSTAPGINHQAYVDCIPQDIRDSLKN